MGMETTEAVHFASQHHISHQYQRAGCRRSLLAATRLSSAGTSRDGKPVMSKVAVRMRMDDGKLKPKEELRFRSSYYVSTLGRISQKNHLVPLWRRVLWKPNSRIFRSTIEGVCFASAFGCSDESSERTSSKNTGCNGETAKNEQWIHSL